MGPRRPRADLGRFGARPGDPADGTVPKAQRRTPRPRTKVRASSVTFVAIRDDDDTTARHDDTVERARVDDETSVRSKLFRREVDKTLKKQHGSEQTKCNQRRSMTMHHPIIPGRQGPPDRESPNRHGNRSRSHNEKSAQKANS